MAGAWKKTQNRGFYYGSARALCCPSLWLSVLRAAHESQQGCAPSPPRKRATRDASSRSHLALSLMALPALACMRGWSCVCWSAQVPAPTMPGTTSADGRMPLPVRRKSPPGATLQRPVPTTGRCDRTFVKAPTLTRCRNACTRAGLSKSGMRTTHQRPRTARRCRGAKSHPLRAIHCTSTSTSSLKQSRCFRGCLEGMHIHVLSARWRETLRPDARGRAWCPSQRAPVTRPACTILG